MALKHSDLYWHAESKEGAEELGSNKIINDNSLYMFVGMHIFMNLSLAFQDLSSCYCD